MNSRWQAMKNKVIHAVHDGVEGFSDPWHTFDIHGIPAERVKRHRYISVSGMSIFNFKSS